MPPRAGFDGIIMKDPVRRIVSMFLFIFLILERQIAFLKLFVHPFFFLQISSSLNLVFFYSDSPLPLRPSSLSSFSVDHWQLGCHLSVLRSSHSICRNGRSYLGDGLCLGAYSGVHLLVPRFHCPCWHRRRNALRSERSQFHPGENPPFSSFVYQLNLRVCVCVSVFFYFLNILVLALSRVFVVVPTPSHIIT